MNAKDAIRDVLSDEMVGSGGYRKALADVVDRAYRSGEADRDGAPIVLRADGIAQGDLRIVDVDAIVAVLASRAGVRVGVAARIYEWFRFAQRHSA